MPSPSAALIVSAVPPHPLDSGKRVVLDGLVRYLCDRLGPAAVHYALIAAPDAPLPPLPCAVHRLNKPRPAPRLRAALVDAMLLGRRSLQEALSVSSKLRRELDGLRSAVRPDLEVYDTVRLGQLVVGRPGIDRRVLYLDDLFSLRYERMLAALAADGELRIDPLGEFAGSVPGPLRRLARGPLVYRTLLRRERGLIDRRERELVWHFRTSLLVNAEEVSQLRERSGSTAIERLTPFLAAAPATPTRCPATPPELVFLGRLNIPHNEDALRRLLELAMPRITRDQPEVVVRAVGKGASPALRRLAGRYSGRFVLEGYVEDLDATLGRATAVLAPMRLGTGVKIKIIEALARGVPVLATSLAVKGVPFTRPDREGCIVVDDVARWPEVLPQLADPEVNERLSRAARAFFDRTYRRGVVYAEYDRLFGLHPAAGAAL